MSVSTRRVGTAALTLGLVFSTTASVLTAQGADRIAGVVTDARVRPIEGAQVRVIGSTAGAVTNNRGQFTIQNLTGPSVSIRITSLGHEPVTRTVPVGTTDLRVALTEVADDRYRLPTASCHFRTGVFKSRAGTAADNEGRSSRRQSECQSAPDASPASGHDRLWRIKTCCHNHLCPSL